jgi:hypothetical protein
VPVGALWRGVFNLNGEVHERFAPWAKYAPACDVKLKGMTMRDLLDAQRYEEAEATKALLTFCREDIVAARLKLASDDGLGAEEHARLWRVIEDREWFMKMLAEDFRWQLEQVDRELEMKLQR